MKRFLFIFLILVWGSADGNGQDRRSRSEGIPGLAASNTVGVGNIIVTGGTQCFFQTDSITPEALRSVAESHFGGSVSDADSLGEGRIRRQLLVSPEINGTIGLAGFFHFSASTIPWNGNKIGNTTASLKFTLPGNDNLRIIGMGGTFDITLSTEENIITVQEETPTFSPIFSFTGIMDLDFIKKYPDFPAKVYMNFSTLDDPRYHTRYRQSLLKIGFEMKEKKYSWYGRAGAALYQDRVTDDFLVPFSQAGLGYRKRFTGKLPFTAAIDFEVDPFHPLAFWDGTINKSPRLSLLIETALYFKETSTEAQRMLIFTERDRRRTQNTTGLPSRAGRAAQLTLDRLMIQRLDRDFLADEQLDTVFTGERERARESRRMKIFNELRKMDNRIDVKEPDAAE